MKLSIIIPTFKREEIFNISLQNAIEAIKDLDAEIIVVNDDSNKAIQLKTESPKIIYINNPLSGVASARNFGFSQSKGEIILFIDNDIIIDEKCVEIALETLKDNSCLNINWEYPIKVKEDLQKTKFGRFMIAEELISLRGWMNNEGWRANKIFYVKNIASYFLMMQRQTFEKIGGYDESFPFAGFEDYAFSKEATKSGVNLIMNTKVTAIHNEKDRTEMEDWLERQKRGAKTRKIAVENGHIEVAIQYNLIKRIIFNFISFFDLSLKWTMSFIPNKKNWDSIYSFILKRRLGGKIFKGYNSKH